MQRHGPAILPATHEQNATRLAGGVLAAVIDRGPANVLGVLVHRIDAEATVARIIDAAGARRPLTVSALAVHGVMTGALDREQQWRLNHLDVVVPDGQPVRWALNVLHGAQLSDRVYGPDLMLAVCNRAEALNLPVYLYGSRRDVLDDLVSTLRCRFPKLAIAGCRPSLFRTAEKGEHVLIAHDIVASGARIVFLGLGCPRQEIWAHEQGVNLPCPVVAVGAAFEFHAGSIPQAPPLLQRHGLEWLFRLACEPRRLWRRYVLLNPLYVLLLGLQAARLVRFGPESARRPAREIGWA